MRIRMDWTAVKFDWNRARAFLVTAEEGSLSAAARALGMTQPTLGRQVDALEAELDVILFERAGRGLVLTPSGLELLDYVRAMGEAANRVSLAASGQSQTIEGLITITASEIYAHSLLPPIIASLRKEHPGIIIEVVASNQTLDLRRREADIAIRSYQPTEPDLICKKVRDDHAYLYASNAYLNSIDNPATAEQLCARGDFIGFDRSNAYVKGLNKLGLNVTQANIKVMTSNHLLQLELAREGVGIAVFPETVGLNEPDLRRALENFPPLVFPKFLVAHREVNTSRRVRFVFDYLARAMKA